MTTQDDSIEYSGPDLKYKPGIGGKDAQPPRATGTPSDGYHDINRLRDLLKRLIEENNLLINEAESELKKFSLKINENARLTEANAIQWPQSLGTPKTYIPYMQYKALGVDNTRGANYIRKVYEDYIRGPDGTNALDVVFISSIIINEATNIQEFLDDYIGDIDDTAEYRTIELLQDWAENAISTSKAIRKIFEQRENTQQISSSELDPLSPQAAEKYQALFKVKLNAVNDQLAQMQEEIKKDQVTLSAIYYKKFLGPALQFRLGAMREIDGHVSRGGILGEEAKSAHSAINANFSVLLGDQLKRNISFSEKIERVQTRIRERDVYSGYVKQLASKGREIKSNFSDISLTATEQKFFEEQQQSIAVPNVFSSSHEELSKNQDNTAHPQYLLKAGDMITGNITIKDGAKIDGIVPHAHQHTGIDGSSKLRGQDILGGTIPGDAVDPDDRPIDPTELKIVSQTRRVEPPGLTIVDVVISWEGQNHYKYEVQVARVQ